jgi:hypothetical protein
MSVKQKDRKDVAAGRVEDLLNRVIGEEEDRSWYLDEILYGGPPHKQAYSALLLQQAARLIELTEARTGQTFAIQEGLQLEEVKRGFAVPVPLVTGNKLKGKEQQELVDTLNHAPMHELLAFNLLLQAMHWCETTGQQAV